MRQGFLDLAMAEPFRYLVLAADGEATAIHRAVLDRVTPLLPERALVASP